MYNSSVISTKEKTRNALIKTKGVPGPLSKEIFDEESKMISPGLQTIALLSKLVIKDGSGSILTDIDGNKFIDFNAGVGVCSLGHSHPKYVRALKEQLEKVNVGSFTTNNRLNFLKLLKEITPPYLNRTQLYSSGAEAVEAAIRLAKSYTKKTEILGFWGGFHGKTGGVLGLLGDDFKHNLGPLMPGLHLAPYGNCYRCPFAKRLDNCSLFCADYVRDVVKYQTTGNIAAFILEPMQGTAGNVIPPPGYIKMIHDIAKENNALLIADEMLTGFGRTGRYFGFEHDEVIPDIITIGKGMASGFPVSGIITNDQIAISLPFANPSGSSSSYGGNPLASCASYITLKTILEENLTDNSCAVGNKMKARLTAMQDKYDFIGDVRGRGLFLGIELVKDKKTRELIAKPLTQKLFRMLLGKGLILMAYTPKIRINPPLSISEDVAMEGMDILEETFEEFKKEL